MERFEGKFPGTFVYYFAGYTYHRDKRPNACIYRCSEKSCSNCKGKVQIVGERPIVRTRHNMHPPSLMLLDELKFKREVLRRCRDTLDTFDEIFREASLLYPEAAVNVTQISISGSMYRARRAARPAVPETLEEFSRVLREYEPVQELYRGCARSADQYSALVFANREMLQLLNTATEIYVDGTFRVVPGRPRACQLFVVYVRYMGVGFPVAFALCEKRTTGVYEAVFRFLLNLAPGLQERLQIVTSDFERAIIAAVRTVFPNATPRGCWFHYCKAVFKKWRSLLHRSTPKEILWQLMGIPLLPVERQAEALAIVEAAGDRMAERSPAILRLLHYFRRQWVPLGDVISVGRAPTRTNNICETFNKYICGRLGGSHPNIWIFLRKLTTLMAGQNIDIRRLERGERIRRGRRSRQRHDDARLAYQQEELEAGRISVQEFLAIAVIPRHRRTMEAVNYMHEAQGNDPDPVDLPGLNDFHPPNNPVAHEADLPNEPDLIAVPEIAPVIGVAVERNLELDNDDADLNVDFGLPPTPPIARNNIIVADDDNIDDDVEDVADAIILSSDDEDDDDDDFHLVLEPIVEIGEPEANVPVAAEPVVPVAPPAPIVEAAAAQRPVGADPGSDEEPDLALRPCTVCLLRRPNIIFLRCGHCVICSQCDRVHTTYARTCVVCRARIERRVTVYFS